MGINECKYKINKSLSHYFKGRYGFDKKIVEILKKGESNKFFQIDELVNQIDLEIQLFLKEIQKIILQIRTSLNHIIKILISDISNRNRFSQEQYLENIESITIIINALSHNFSTKNGEIKNRIKLKTTLTLEKIILTKVYSKKTLEILEDLKKKIELSDSIDNLKEMVIILNKITFLKRKLIRKPKENYVSEKKLKLALYKLEIYGFQLSLF